MKKNVMMRIASVLMICVLISTCGISGTFAKYVTKGEASDSARVAKWGVEIFNNGQRAFAEQYGTTVKTSVSNQYIVAPGTDSDDVNGNLIFGITGTPEVAIKVTTEFTCDDIRLDAYHPIKFTLHYIDENAVIAGAKAIAENDPRWQPVPSLVNVSLADLATAINGMDFEQDPNESLDALYMITWDWEFDTARDGYTTEQINEMDTILGNLAAGMDPAEVGAGSSDFNYNLSYTVNILIEQVD